MWNNSLLGFANLLKMAVTGRQAGDKKLHMAYRIMIFFIFAAIIGSFFVVRFSK